MHRFSTFSLFLLSVTLLIAVFGTGYGNAADAETTTADVEERQISVLPIPEESTAVTGDEPPTLTTEDDGPTITSDPETSVTIPPITTSSTTDETTTSEDPPTITEPTSTSTSSTKEAPPTTSSETFTTKSKEVITTIVTVSGSTIQQTFTPTADPTEDGSSATEAPGLNGGDDGEADSGIDSDQKSIIIGVVVGVGGAILLGGLAVVAWRVWGRKRNDGYQEEDEDMMSAGTAVGSAGRDKASSPSNAGSSPFKSTLDQYHNPGPVNAASNF